MASRILKVGDKLRWNSLQRQALGTVNKKLTALTDINTHQQR